MSSEISQKSYLATQCTGLKNAALPIFFFQSGSKTGFFFDKILKQAVLTNGWENVYILADSNFEIYKGYNCINISKYYYGTKRFDALYQHHSTNKLLFEKACFDRWFIINTIVKEYQIDYFFHADSDVLIAEDLKPVYERFLKNNYDGSMMFFENGAGRSITSGHSSFWNSKLIDDFCNFVCETYADAGRFSQVLNDAVDGKFYDNTNVSDMILLDVFRTETKPATLNLFSLEEKNICFDFNVNVSYNGFKYNFACSPFFKIKKLARYPGGIFGYAENEKNVAPHLKFYTLHFQGYLTKSLIPLYVNSKSVKESIINYLTGIVNFQVRKLKLLKTKIKVRTRDFIHLSQ